jgi:hypothetical protein
MKKALISILIAIISTPLFAQIGKKVNEFKETHITNAAIDRLGEFYLQVANGSIKKYDTEGKHLFTFLAANDSITALHPWNPLNVFIYNRHKQTLLFLDRTLNIVERKAIDPSLAIEPSLACAGNNNNNYWLYDKADQSIKKINLPNGTISFDIDLTKVYGSQIPGLVYLREYQNQLFLLDKKAGIKIISITGKLIQSFPSEEISNIGFLGEELYYLENGTLKFYDL